MGLRVQHDFRGVSSFCKSWQKLIPANIVTQKNMRKVIWEIFSAMGWNINPVLIKYLFYCYYFLGWINNICSLLITALRAIDIHGIWQPRPSTLTQLQWILPLGKMPPALNEIITSLSLCRGTWLCPSFSAKKPVCKGFSDIFSWLNWCCQSHNHLQLPTGPAGAGAEVQASPAANMQGPGLCYRKFTSSLSSVLNQGTKTSFVLLQWHFVELEKSFSSQLCSETSAGPSAYARLVIVGARQNSGSLHARQWGFLPEKLWFNKQGCSFVLSSFRSVQQPAPWCWAMAHVASCRVGTARAGGSSPAVLLEGCHLQGDS